MNRSIQLPVFLLPILFACSQKPPEVSITPSSVAATATPGTTIPDPATPDGSSTPIFSSPFISPSASASSKAATAANKSIPDSQPDYQIPSALPIVKPQPPKLGQTQASTSQATSKTDNKKAAEVLQEPIITSDGIGRAKVGMTLGELKQVLGATAQFVVKENFVANYNAIAVMQQGKVQYYIPFPQDSNFGDRDRIRFLITDNPNYKTSQGVSPGMPIEKAATLYGAATLSLSREVNAQEIVKFANQPKELVFRSQQPPGQDLAGIYPESNDDELETNKYANKSTIRSIIVSCKDEVCGEEH